MKQIVKILYLVVLFSVFIISCQTDIDNTIPKVAKKLSDAQQEFKNTLTKNSIKENKKIWVSNNLRYKQGQFRNILTGESYENNFFVAFNFTPNNIVQIYVTSPIVGQINKMNINLYNYFSNFSKIMALVKKKKVVGLFKFVSSAQVIRRDNFQVKSNASDLYDNINTYRIAGELRVNLTILNKGILSNLKRESLMGFDYRVTDFNNTEIKMKPYFTQTTNSEITLRPYDYDTFKTFKKATEILCGVQSKGEIYVHNRQGYYLGIGSLRYLESLWHSTKISIIKNSTKSVVYTVNSNKFIYPNFLRQDYDKSKNIFVFRFIDLSEDVIRNIIKSPSFSFFYDTNKDIKYLVPINVTDDKMVFETYGSKKESDKKYTVTITKIP